MLAASVLLLHLAHASADVPPDELAERRTQRGRAIRFGVLTGLAVAALPCTPVYPCVGVPLALLYVASSRPAGGGMHDRTLQVFTACAAGVCLPLVAWDLAEKTVDAWEASR